MGYAVSKMKAELEDLRRQIMELTRAKETLVIYWADGTRVGEIAAPLPPGPMRWADPAPHPGTNETGD